MNMETDQEVIDRLELKIKDLQKQVARIKRWGNLSAKKRGNKG